MKTLLGLAAAALLLPSAGVNAGTTKITVSLLGFDCTVAVTTFSDADNGIGSKDLLAGDSSDCSFVGGGALGS